MKIIWTKKAKILLENIFQFYVELYGKKKAEQIRDKILDTPDILEQNPLSGKIETYFSDLEENKTVRSIIQKHSKILYEVFEKEEVVLILSVFDTRQDPDKMKV
jgi:plasmid stabilization system protein ParE